MNITNLVLLLLNSYYTSELVLAIHSIINSPGHRSINQGLAWAPLGPYVDTPLSSYGLAYKNVYIGKTKYYLLY